MTKDGHHLIGRRSSTLPLIRVGMLVAVAAVQSRSVGQEVQSGPIAEPAPHAAELVPDISCEPVFHSGDCSDYSFCLDLWQNYCYERRPRGSGFGLACRLHGLRGCQTCGRGCSSNRGNCSAGLSTPIPTPTHATEPPSASGPDHASQRVTPESPLAPHETTPVTPPEIFPPDLNQDRDLYPDRDRNRDQDGPQDPPVPDDLPFPPLNDLPRNELPLFPVSIAARPKVAPTTVPAPLVYSWQQKPQQPPEPAAVAIDHADVISVGTLRLVQHLNQASQGH